MTVLQSRTAFKAMMVVVTMLLPAVPHPAMAQEEDEEWRRQPLFSCGTDSDGGEGYLDISAIEVAAGVWDDLRFERRANVTGDVVYTFPVKDVDYRTAFRFSHSDGEEGYLVSIRWEDGGSDYVYYSLYIPPDSRMEDDVGGGEAGLAISKDGALVERVSCTERPYMFISYMRESMSCDTANPYGPEACEDSPADRTVALDVDGIGIVTK